MESVNFENLPSPNWNTANEQSPPANEWSSAPAAQEVKEFLTPQDGVDAGERSEGTVTKQIESVTTKVPSGTFLSFALGSMGLSALLHLNGRKDDAMFVGQWVPAILIMGLYNKLVKLEGSSSR